MIVLGIDPGTAITGYGVVRHTESGLECIEYGCIRTPKEEAHPARLLLLEKGLLRLLKAHAPDLVAVERLFFFRNLTTAMPVSEARGVILLSCARKRLPVCELTPLQVKMTIGGYGRADKKQVQRMVQEILKLPSLPKPDDAADGLGIAIAGGLAWKGG
ncbi:MAG: crossover junction endodeoxyribonuclease RuvC [Patescibacteria group bacterium]